MYSNVSDDDVSYMSSSHVYWRVCGCYRRLIIVLGEGWIDSSVQCRMTCTRSVHITDVATTPIDHAWCTTTTLHSDISTPHLISLNNVARQCAQLLKTFENNTSKVRFFLGFFGFMCWICLLMIVLGTFIAVTWVLWFWINLWRNASDLAFWFFAVGVVACSVGLLSYGEPRRWS